MYVPLLSPRATPFSKISSAVVSSPTGKAIYAIARASGASIVNVTLLNEGSISEIVIETSSSGSTLGSSVDSPAPNSSQLTAAQIKAKESKHLPKFRIVLFISVCYLLCYLFC